MLDPDANGDANSMTLTAVFEKFMLRLEVCTVCNDACIEVYKGITSYISEIPSLL